MNDSPVGTNPTAQVAAAAAICLENQLYRVDIDPRTGAVVQLRDKAGGLDLIAEPRLADSFRLLLPLPQVRCNYLVGLKQKPPVSAPTASGVQLTWAGPLQSEQGQFDLDVTLWIELVDESVQFRCAVHNRTEHQLTEVWYAALGGMRGLGDGDEARDTELVLPKDNRGWRQPIFRDFANTRGQTLGVFGAEHSFGYPGFMCMPWASLFHPGRKRALYLAALEESPRVKALRFELMPGVAESRAGGNWPRPQEVGDEPLGLTLNWVHFPFTKPGETFTSAPVIVRAHAGDWRQAAEIYRQWFTSKYPVVEPGSTWIRRETTFLHTMFMLPEDNINLRFVDMPQWAKDAKARGINHLMIAGWQIGGHDRGYPQYEPDPRLGTWEELQAGIAAAHQLGMRVSFFVNCQPADVTTDWYKQELHKYRILDPYGQSYFLCNYWGMGTLSARTRFLTATPNAELNPAHPEVRELLIRRFRRLIEIGADGLHFDKFFQTPFDFNPRLTWTSPDRAHHEGLLLFVQELFATCRAINPEFCISYEGGWDRFMSYAETMWWGQGEDIVLKAVFPQIAFNYGIEQPYDYNKVNRAILQGQNLLIGPANYNRGTEYPPMQKLLAYIDQLTRIRNELYATVSGGELLDASEGIFRQAQPLVQLALAQHVRWTLWGDPKSGQRCIVLANMGLAAVAVAGLQMTGANGACRVHQPFQPVRQARLPLTLELPAETAVFVAVDA